MNGSAKPFHTWILFLVLMIFHTLFSQEPRTIALTWKDVVGKTRSNNLSLQIAYQDYRIQQLEERKALSRFLPQISYQGVGTRNIELPEFVFKINGLTQRVRVGTRYNVSHTLQLNLPLFMGGLRWANWGAQRELRKSLAEELRGQEAGVILSALQSYYQILLAEMLIQVNDGAVRVARENLEQVEKFYRVGSASRLDVLQARSRLAEVEPAVLSARHQKKLAVENLKFILNLSPQDTIVVLDSLQVMDFLGRLGEKSLDELTALALQHRPELQMMAHSARAVSKQKTIAASQFLPSVAFSAAVDHQAQVDQLYPAGTDYVRVKRALITIQFPLFQGSERWWNYQQARVQHKKLQLQLQQLQQQVVLEVRQRYFQMQEMSRKLNGLKKAVEASQENLRLARLYFRQGMATQLEVLSAQVQHIQNLLKYHQGVFDYNISQLKLLKAIGQLDEILEKNAVHARH
ncbi:MAG: TolC family protein [Calditrichaeota bacterium]|nr:TolC family protein [Calditrichota bacterium]